METFPLPPDKLWKFGRCFCCDRPTLVAPGPAFGPGMTLGLCRVGFERAERQLHRAKLRAALHNREVSA